MNRTTLQKIGGALAALFMWGAAVHSQSPNQSANLPNAPADGETVSDDAAAKAVGEYLLGTKVNETPAIMQPAVATLCAPASRGTTPHSQFYLSVYVNDRGKSAIVETRPKFPVGTVLVKEKLKLPTTLRPELLTAMVKREPGYDPEYGDWEYFVLTGDAQQVTARGKLTNCRSCHADQKPMDYTFLSYLTPKDRERLLPRR